MESDIERNPHASFFARTNAARLARTHAAWGLPLTHTKKSDSSTIQTESRLYYYFGKNLLRAVVRSAMQ